MRFALALLLLTTPALADDIVGRASVIDGDTIEIHDTRIRFNGVDAPETSQTCYNAVGAPYRCGARAAEALDALLAASRPTTCRKVGADRYGRVVAVCWTNAGQDVGEWMVANGWSFDWPKYSGRAYEPAQRIAARRKLGLWSGIFDWPWDVRALKRNKRP